MKFKALFSLCLSATFLTVSAQTHVEGVEYYKADQFGNAKELLQRNYDKPGTDKSVADYYLGLIALRDKNIAEAQKHFDKGLQTESPKQHYNLVGKAAILLKNGKTKEAEALLKEAEKKGKKDPELQIAIARAYYDADPALYAKEIGKRVEKARKINAYSPAIFIFEGDQSADQKDFNNAGTQYEMATTYDQKASDAYVKYANLFTQVNPEYAIIMLNKLLDQNPNSALGQREIANAYYNHKDFKNAAEHYGKYVLNPNHFKQDEDRYAFLLFYGGQYKKGYDYSTELLKKDPSNFTAQRYQFMNAAQIKEMKDQLLPMAEALYKAHKSSPKNSFAPIDYTLIAEEFTAAKRPQEAIEVLEEAIKEMPENAAFNKQLAMVYVDTNDISKAADEYQKYISKLEKPGYNDFIQQATFSYYGGIENKNNPAEADKYFNDAIKYAKLGQQILPDNYKPIKIMGDVAKQRASKENVETAAADLYLQAIDLLEKAKDPSRYKSDAKELYNYMGNYYLDKKDVAKAKEYFNKYLIYDPNNADYRKFVEGLK